MRLLDKETTLTLEDYLYASINYNNDYVDNRKSDSNEFDKFEIKSDFTDYLSQDIINEISINYLNLRCIINLQKVNKKCYKGKFSVKFH